MIILSPLGWIYSWIIGLRNVLYDRELLKSYSLGARTISIGNLTTGGTGKTPMVALVAGILAEQGENVCVLTRGYGRRNPKERVLVSDGETVLADAETGGDEPVELARRLIGKAVVVADADRVAAAHWAKDKFGITAFILDDGFQQRRANRDLDIVCIDATNPFGNGRILPAGTLRESFNHLKRADAIVVTRANLVDSTAEIVKRLQKRNPDASIFLSENRIVGFVELARFKETSVDSTNTLGNRRFAAFCALGNPENFFQQLRLEGLDLALTERFRDHHRYSQNDVDRLELIAKAVGAHAFVTTAKDAVKLFGLRFEIECLVAEIETVVIDGGSFRNLIVSL
ncbi:MAG: tetraacyldisaccharide 4'-kinase [Blastocatellia bacterium]